MLCASPLSVFSHKVHNMRFEKEIRVQFQITAIERKSPVSKSSVRISEFYFEHKLHKTRIENQLSVGVELGSP